MTRCMLTYQKLGEWRPKARPSSWSNCRLERDRVTVTIARREIRKWLRESRAGQTVEKVVSGLLDRG